MFEKWCSQVEQHFAHTCQSFRSRLIADCSAVQCEPRKFFVWFDIRFDIFYCHRTVGLRFPTDLFVPDWRVVRREIYCAGFARCCDLRLFCCRCWKQTVILNADTALRWPKALHWRLIKRRDWHLSLNCKRHHAACENNCSHSNPP